MDALDSDVSWLAVAAGIVKILYSNAIMIGYAKGAPGIPHNQNIDCGT